MLRRFVMFLSLVVLAGHTTGCATSGAAKFQVGSDKRPVEWIGGVGSDKGRLDIHVMVLDGEGTPVTNEKVTLLTNRNETFVQYTSTDIAIAATHEYNSKGGQVASRASTLGTAVFGGVRGGLHSVVIFVRGRPYNLANADLLKGWDQENNLVNLVVTLYGVTSSELQSSTSSPAVHPSASQPSTVETKVDRLRTLQASYLKAQETNDEAGMTKYGSEMNEILAVLTGSPTIK